MNRRSFLKRVGLAAGAAALPCSFLISKDRVPHCLVVDGVYRGDFKDYEDQKFIDITFYGTGFETEGYRVHGLSLGTHTLQIRPKGNEFVNIE